MKNTKEDSANNAALITEYDAQISKLIQERNRIVNERDNLIKKNDENVECYDSTIKAKNELQSVLNNIIDYARTNKQKVDSRLKMLKNLYESLERSTYQSKMQHQIEELDRAMNSVRKTIDDLDGRIDYLNIQIGNVEREIERIRSLKRGIING